ncbi:MAG TPA: pyridoxamine 5'-phosphate oxidase family protein [Candidatus Thermoplasmatota archaeon]|nr:pyridoxamine 5'-phosphate oxidase family protein [Candidatus Thermoplasmatota archaeon]
MEELASDACKEFLMKHRIGVMALAKEGKAYAVPLFYAYDGNRLYFHSHPGHKDEVLAGTEEACFVVVEAHGDDDWTSVQATGSAEKITLSDDAMQALDVMAKNPFPPEFGSNPKGYPNRSAANMYLWMMTPGRITGRKSRTPNPRLRLRPEEG